MIQIDSFNSFIFSADKKLLGKLQSKQFFCSLTKHVPGDIVELGVFKGSGLVAWLKTLEYSDPASKQVIGFDSFEGLLVHYAVEQQADAIVRGIRAISDYEYELQMALMNRRLEPKIETVFMMPAEAYSYVSSRLVKEVFLLGGELDGLVPQLIETRMKEKAANS